MRAYSVAANKPINIVVRAHNKAEAIEYARQGKGYEDDAGMDNEITATPKKGVEEIAK